MSQNIFLTKISFCFYLKYSFLSIGLRFESGWGLLLKGESDHGSSTGQLHRVGTVPVLHMGGLVYDGF